MICVNKRIDIEIGYFVVVNFVNFFEYINS